MKTGFAAFCLFAFCGASSLASEGFEFFEKSVRPILIGRCYECHSAESKKLKGGLRLDSKEGWSIGGDTGPAIVSGEPDASLLIKVIRHEIPDVGMPPKEKLSAHEIDALVKWIKMGTPDPRIGDVPIAKENISVEKGREFWAFKTPVLAAVPNVKNRAWPKTDIDHFILAKLEEKKIKPVSDATTRDLVRRVYFDLIGLPPSPEEIENFLNAPAKDRIEKTVDALLASPRFGEKWGRHWLDLARYSDSTGGGRSAILANAWRYRNYVIDSYNRDKSFDDFIREQIAGDLLTSDAENERAEKLIATGFLAIGPKNLDLQDKELLRMNGVDEQIDTVGRTFLAMTLGCARCHDHKFDPIPTRDYYALAGIFRSTKSMIRDNVSKLVEQPLLIDAALVEENKKHADAVGALKRKIKRAQSEIPQTDEIKSQISKFEAELKTLEAKPPPPLPQAICVTDEEDTGDYNICVRGNVHQLGAKVPRGFIQVASNDKNFVPTINERESGRRELADWLASTNNPLTARVYVNRIWSHLFGAGIVRSVDDFGKQGEKPTHPELLDYLAIRFIQEGWSTKKLIREIVLSRVYQLSAEDRAACRKVDPQNDLRWRMPRRRLDAEALRDTILLVSGNLEIRVAESLLPSELQNDVALKRTRADVDRFLDLPLRSVYIPVFREEGMNDLLEVFDFANPNFTVGQRNVSTLPSQALFLMNSSFVMEQARDAAKALLASGTVSEKEYLRRAYLKTLGRLPTSEETKLTLDFLKDSRKTGSDPVEAWSFVFHTLFACVDFRYLD